MGSCDSCVISSTTVPAGASTVRNGNPTICSGSSNVAKAPSPGGGSSRHAPSPDGVGRGLVHDLEGAGHAVLEPVARVAEPADTAGARQAADGPERLADERHLAGPQLRGGGVDAAVGEVVVVAPGGGRAVGRHLQHLRRRPGRVRGSAGLAPARRPQPCVEVLLQRPQVPPLELPRPVRTVEEGAPGSVAHDLADATAGFLHAQGEEEAGLAEGPGALAVTVEEDLDADHVRARHQPAREVDRVGLVRARVARRGAPLHAAAVDEEPVAAVGRDPASGRSHLALHLDLAPEEDEGVGEGALAGQPDPAGGREVDPRAGLRRRPRALRDAGGRGRGLARDGLDRRRRRRLRLARARGGRPLLLRPLRRLRGGRGYGDGSRDRRAEAPQEGPAALVTPSSHQRPPRGRIRSSGGCDRGASSTSRGGVCFVCSHRATISSAGPVFEGVTIVAARTPSATIF